MDMGPKAHGCGGQEYPARKDEIKIFGWRARRVFRVSPAPPLSKSFAEIVREGEMPREGEDGGGPRRRFVEERLSGRGVAGDPGWRRPGEDHRCEQQLRDRAFREREIGHFGGARSIREDEFHPRRRMGEYKEGNLERVRYEEQRERTDLGQNKYYQSSQDRQEGDGRGVATRGRENPRLEGLKTDAGRPSRRKEDVICFWCRGEGHHQADCTNPPSSSDARSLDTCQPNARKPKVCR